MRHSFLPSVRLSFPVVCKRHYPQPFWVWNFWVCVRGRLCHLLHSFSLSFCVWCGVSYPVKRNRFFRSSQQRRHSKAQNHNTSPSPHRPSLLKKPPIHSKDHNIKSSLPCSSMKSSDLVLIFACLMFSSITRAFRSATPLYQRSMARALATSNPPPPETSIVDICQQKIQAALKAESVKVTG